MAPFVACSPYLSLEVPLFESGIQSSSFQFILFRRKTSPFLQVGFGDGPCSFYSTAKEGGGEDPSTSWSWIRILVDDIIFWGFALLCSIVLPLDKKELWQGRTQSTNNISLEQRIPLLKFSFGLTTQRSWPLGCKGILIYFPQMTFLLKLKALPDVFFSISLFMVVTMWIYLDFSFTGGLVLSCIQRLLRCYSNLTVVIFKR